MQKEEKETEEMDIGESRYEEYVLAIHDHQGQDELKELADEPRKKIKTENSDLLTMKKGECIKVMSKDRSGWWYGQKYNSKTKELYGSTGWFPPTYTKAYFTSLKPINDNISKNILQATQYPADFLNHCYVSGLNPLQASTQTSGQQQFFKGLPLLENEKDSDEPAQKAVKELNKHFDYEQWNEHMNKIDPRRRKPKPNPKLKKTKKIKW
jgi:Variant SH3 domain